MVDAKSCEKVCGKNDQLDIGLRLACANDLRIQLMKLAEAALLRAFVSESGTPSSEL